MDKFSRRALALLPLWMVATAQATQPPALKDEGSKACTMSLSVIALRLVDAQGAPVQGATMRAWRASNKRLLAGAGAFGSAGDYKVMEDGDFPDLRPEGEAFEVEFQKDGRKKRVSLRIGMDAKRCHVKLLEGESRIVF